MRLALQPSPQLRVCLLACGAPALFHFIVPQLHGARLHSFISLVLAECSLHLQRSPKRIRARREARVRRTHHEWRKSLGLRCDVVSSVRCPYASAYEGEARVYLICGAIAPLAEGFVADLARPTA